MPPDAFAGEAVKVWERNAKRAITQEDVRQATNNVSGFFSLLLNWDVSSNTKAS